ncbi:MAG TPA: BatA and WFA domain-containing protein, partial [Elusimicrobiota bacterium]|nr:BatA and WFA domain-containing protein [Elusimicrobiota bacterium]
MSVSFLQPVFLWFLPLALAPLLLHWLTRSKPRPLAFSSLELLRESVRAHLARSRLMNFLLLLCRCLLLAALCLLFSRPVVHWGKIVDVDDAMTTVFLLDASASMGASHAGATSFDNAKACIRTFLENAGKDDRFGLVVFSETVEMSVLPTANKDRVAETASGAELSFRPTDVLPAFESAYQMLAAEREGPQAIVLLSDLAKNGWRRFLSQKAGGREFDPRVRVLLAEMNPEGANAAVVSAAVRSGPQGGLIQGSFEAREWGASPGERRWGLSLNGATVTQGVLVSAEGGAPPQKFSLPERFLIAGGEAEIRLDPDALPADDRLFFRLERPAGFSVLVVNGSPDV